MKAMSAEHEHGLHVAQISSQQFMLNSPESQEKGAAQGFTMWRSSSKPHPEKLLLHPNWMENKVS